MENKTKLYVRSIDDQEWTKLNDATVCISHGDEKGELGDSGSQFANLVKDESVYHKILRCVKYGDKVPRKYMRKYNLVVKNLKNMKRNQ